VPVLASTGLAAQRRQRGWIGDAGDVERICREALKNRMELFRRSLHAFLLEAGEVRVAELFAPEA